MADKKFTKNDIVKLAVDAHRGSVQNYSVGESQEVLRQALVELNNGSTKLNFKDIRDGKCPGLFSLIEEILGEVVYEDVVANPYFVALVETRNLKAGDKNIFKIKDKSLFVVDEIAPGTQGIRRQRLGGATEVSVPTTFKGVRIYEELDRVLSHGIDFNEFIDKVADSFKQKLFADVQTLWEGVTADQMGGTTYFPVAGAFDEGKLLDLIAHVEAAAGGKTATILGSKKALRQLKASVQNEGAKDDLYNMGYYGKFYGTPVVALNQTHVPGTDKFALNDDVLTIIAGDEKPIKLVYEGDPLILMGNPADNADLTQEYFYREKYGVALVTAGQNSGIGRYDMSAA